MTSCSWNVMSYCILFVIYSWNILKYRVVRKKSLRNKKRFGTLWFWSYAYRILDFVWCYTYKFTSRQYLKYDYCTITRSFMGRWHPDLSGLVLLGACINCYVLRRNYYNNRLNNLFMGRWQSGQLHQTVNLTPHGYVGSNPTLPKLIYMPIYGPLAHLARAPALHAGGEGFDSPRVQIVFV